VGGGGAPEVGPRLPVHFARVCPSPIPEP
jgi:hypothetical protein